MRPEKNLKIELLAIGNELVTGLIADTNSQYLASELLRHGFRVSRICVSGDDPHEIANALKSGAQDMDVIIVTGGLGPTPDDITRESLSGYLGLELVLEEAVLEDIKNRYRMLNMPVPEGSEKQSLFPDGSKPIPNSAGIAPGIHARTYDADIFCVPGVPAEMKAMFQSYILPRLKAQHPEARTVSAILRTTGITESALNAKLGELGVSTNEIEVAFLPRGIGVDIRLLMNNAESEKALDIFTRRKNQIERLIFQWIYGFEEEKVEEIVGRMLKQCGKSLAVAESCTGGLISKKLTDVGGSSGYFREGVVTYSNESKSGRLGVDGGLLERHGAVSREVVDAMCTGLKKTAGCDIAVAVSGIAGPEGGTAQKPVGTVYIGVYSEQSEIIAGFLLPGNRHWVRNRAAQAALDMVRRMIIGQTKLPDPYFNMFEVFYGRG